MSFALFNKLCVTCSWVSDSLEHGRVSTIVDVRFLPHQVLPSVALPHLEEIPRFRPLANNHYSSEYEADSEEMAKHCVARFIRGLQFASITGLMPSPRGLPPGMTQSLSGVALRKPRCWRDPDTGEVLLLNQPEIQAHYGVVERLASGACFSLSEWGGLHHPEGGDMLEIIGDIRHMRRLQDASARLKNAPSAFLINQADWICDSFEPCD